MEVGEEGVDDDDDDDDDDDGPLIAHDSINLKC